MKFYRVSLEKHRLAKEENFHDTSNVTAVLAVWNRLKILSNIYTAKALSSCSLGNKIDCINI